jgi:hypothetical protein
MVAASKNALIHDDMELVLKGRRDAWNAPLRTFARRRLGRVLGPFSNRIRAVTVWLEDVNGPRGGADKRCRIEVQLARHRSVAVSGLASSEYAAVARAALRTCRVLARRFDKRRKKRPVPLHSRHDSHPSPG